MFSDRQGNRLTGATPTSVAHFDRAVTAFNIYRGDPIALVDQAIAEAPDFIMAHLLKAHVLALATEPAAAAQARTIVDAVRTMAGNERERSHLAALERLLAGRWHDAAVALDHHNVRFPLDLVALQAGHLLDFYRGNARNLRDRIARVLPKWSADVPGYATVLGMHAFGLEETADYGRAEATGRRALALEPLDCWAHHAVAHVLEMQGRTAEGIRWMESRERCWSGDDNVFKIHNWWHLALFRLDFGDIDAVLALYDGPIRQGRSAVVLDVVDATQLLWRLQLAGHDVGDRWQEVSQAWDQHADGRLYPFNDWHAVIAHLGAGRHQAIERIVAGWAEGAGEGGDAAAWARTIALPLAEGFRLFWQGDHQGAVTRLHPVRYLASGFGGSNAQRDIIDCTLTEAAVRGGLTDLAAALAHERLALKPESPINRAYLARAEAGAGRIAA